jgi:hypothetical protein
MNDQKQAGQVTPDSWRGAENDPWWVEQRRLREEERRG